MDHKELVKKLAIGTVQFGVNYGISNKEGMTPLPEVRKILDLASQVGIDTLDTAHAYGESEAVLGSFDLEKKKVISKFPSPKSHSINYFLKKTLIQLNIGKLYGYLAHSAKDLIEDKDIWTQLLKIKRNKLVHKIGYSLYNTEQLRILMEKGMNPDLIQVPYNILDRRFEPFFEKLKTMNVEIHTRSSFLQGLFFTPIHNLHEFYNPIKPFLREFHAKYITNEQKAQVLLNFCLNQKSIDKVVIGVNNYSQLRENISIVAENTNFCLPSIPDFPDKIILPNKWPNK